MRIFTFSAISIVYQNSVVGSFREKWIGRVGISRSCQGPRVLVVSYLTCENGAAVSPQVGAIDLIARRRSGERPTCRHFGRHRLEHAPDVFSKDF